MASKRQPRQLKIDKRDGQITAQGGELANYFMRNISLWSQPSWQTAEVWRQFVARQPVAAIFRDTIANFLNSLDWAVVARDSEQRDELKPKIKHYTKLFERGNAYYYDIDFASHIEWLVKDLFDLPFGCASEIGRVDDNPKGKVVWIRPLDAGTLAPTLNFDYPVVQVAPNTGLNPIYIPRDFVSRVYLSPRTELRREGWGYAPPERILLAIEMLSKGDAYYWQLLLNTPEAGVLDLGDIAKETAEEWVKGLRDLLFGMNPLKIPVLYEHTSQAKWIPFGRPPSEIMYESTTMKYAAIMGAGYGMTLSDIGFPTSSNGGDTLAGTIRLERVGKSSGKSVAKRKLAAYFDKILPDTLKFTWIDYDDERNVSKGRARLASAQAAQIWVDKKIFLPNEIRQQALADGLISIDVPEEVDPLDPAFPQPVSPFGDNIGGSKGQSLGNPKNPSQGGQGEVIPQQVIQRNSSKAEVGIAKSVFEANSVLSVLLKTVRSNLSDSEVEIWEQAVDDYLSLRADLDNVLKDSIDDIRVRIEKGISDSPWINELSESLTEKIIMNETVKQTSEKFFEEEERAEEEFIEGKSDVIQVTPVSVDLSPRRGEVLEFVTSCLKNSIASQALMISKSVLLENLNVDATEATDNNIRTSRQVAAEVVRNLNQIVHFVYENGTRLLGEKDAVS